MTWVQRVGNIFKMLALLVLELVALGTEAAKIFATKADEAVDDLQTKMTTGQPPTTPP